MTTKLTFFGGAVSNKEGELGGVQLLIKDNSTKVMYEIGQRPDHFNQYYGFPQGPRKFQVLEMLSELSLYPDIPNLYRHDLEWHRGNKVGELPLEGIITSHAHYDHIGGLPLLRYDMPVWMDKDSKRILYIWQISSQNDFLDVSYNFSTLPNSYGLDKWASGESATFPRDIRNYKNNTPFRIGDIEFLPIPIDHSLPGAHGFIITTSAGKIGISGDIRKRGRRPENTENFIKKLHDNDVSHIIWEGSLLHFGHNGTEDDVSDKVAEWTKEKALAVVSFPPRDLDRLTSLYYAAKKNKRMLAITPEQAAMLELFQGDYGFPKLEWKYIGVLLPRKNKGIIDNPEYSDWLQEKDYYKPTEKTFLNLKRWDGHLGKAQRISIEDIANYQDQFLVFLPYYYMDMLQEIKPRKNSIYIRSHPGPWTEEMEIQEKRLIKILDHYNMYYGPQKDPFNNEIEHKMHQAHITGHLNREETKEILREFNCTIIPYHCMNPNDFYEFAADKNQILIPKIREEFELR